MAKSTGNLVLVDDMLATCSPPALRLLLIDRHYGDSWDFDQAGIADASARLERLYAAAARATSIDREDNREGPGILDALCDDDLDVPMALARAEVAGGAVARELIKVLRLG